MAGLLDRDWLGVRTAGEAVSVRARTARVAAIPAHSFVAARLARADGLRCADAIDGVVAPVVLDFCYRGEVGRRAVLT